MGFPVQPGSSRGLPRWLVFAGGVALGLALVGAYLGANMPADARELIADGYEQGFAAGVSLGRERGPREVRRTPLAAPAQS